jgi:hypothetical protein
LRELFNELKIDQPLFSIPTYAPGNPLPKLQPLNVGAVALYWSGVKSASGSNGVISIRRPFLEVAGSPVGTQLARIDYGRGRVFVIPGPLLFTNYGLNNPDNAVLATNLIRLHAPAGSAVYFDEREHGELTSSNDDFKPGLLYYLWQPPLRWALLQLLLAGLLLWGFYGRRLGSPVPLPEAEPVTRASQFAIAMGGLFHKVGRPRAAGAVLGEEFRREVTRRLGMSPSDSDGEIAERAARVTGLPAPMIDRLLLHAKVPRDHEADILSDTQEMQLVIERLRSPRP